MFIIEGKVRLSLVLSSHFVPRTCKLKVIITYKANLSARWQFTSRDFSFLKTLFPVVFFFFLFPKPWLSALGRVFGIRFMCCLSDQLSLFPPRHCFSHWVLGLHCVYPTSRMNKILGDQFFICVFTRVLINFLLIQEWGLFVGISYEVIASHGTFFLAPLLIGSVGISVSLTCL